MNIFNNNKHYDLIQKYKDNFGYVLYNCDKKEIVGYHNFYNFYYIGSIMKPIILIIYCFKYNIIINKTDLRKILRNSNNYTYLKYARYITIEDENSFFLKYYGKSNNFSINIADLDLLKDVDLDESYQQFLKLSFDKKKEMLKFEIDYFFLEEINKTSLTNKNFFYMYYFKKNINFYHYRYGMINNLKDYPKASPYFMLLVYNDLFHENKFGDLGKTFVKYMKNIDTSNIPFIPGGSKNNLNNYNRTDFYHKTGNHLFFRNEVLYFKFKSHNYILSYMSQPTHKFKYGIQALKNVKIMMSIVNSYLIDNRKIHQSMNSFVDVKYFSSTKRYTSKIYEIFGNFKYYKKNSNQIIDLNYGFIEKKEQKIIFKYLDKIEYLDSLYIEMNKVGQIKTKNNKNEDENHKIEGELNIFINTYNNINFFLKLPLINYIIGVIYHESLGYWIKNKNKEYIKAFSIIVKNYLISRILNNIKVLNNAMFQIYRYYDDNQIKKIVYETINDYIFNKGIVCTYFGSSCGGQTKSYQNIEGIVDIYEGNRCCDISPYNKWKRSVNLSLLNINDKINKIEYTKNIHFIKEIIFTTDTTDVILSHNELKDLIGWRNIRSNIYELTLDYKNNKLIIEGIGLGHHLGLCVWGAKYLSNEGLSYDKIINHYFKNCYLGKLKI